MQIFGVKKTYERVLMGTRLFMTLFLFSEEKKEEKKEESEESDDDMGFGE